MNVQAPIRILIVEDDEALVERFSLTAADFPDVQLLGAVNSVPEALDFVRRIPIDFVVLDLELANSHGIQFLNAILNGGISATCHCDDCRHRTRDFERCTRQEGGAYLLER